MREDTINPEKPSICFVALDNFATLVDNPKYGHIGGAEMQQTLIGRELAKRGYKVSFVTLDHGQDNETEIDGMHIIKAYDQNAGIRGLRFLHPRLTSLWRAMRKADADIYYQRTWDSVTGIVAIFCNQYCRKFIFGVAHDYDCMIDPPDLLAKHAHALYRYGLRRANLVIAQTMTQQRLLHENFGIDSTIIPNCAPDYGSSECNSNTNSPSPENHILWIGMFKPPKRLELLLDVAEQLPDLQFDVVGDGNRESEYVQSLIARAESMSNVHLHGKVSHRGVEQFYQRGALLICTSHAEGFPNIFLEAWSYGLPIVSTFDPDDLIAERGLGKVGKDISELVARILELLDSPEGWQKASQAARRYYTENHAMDKVMSRFERVFCDIVRSISDNTNGDSV